MPKTKPSPDLNPELRGTTERERFLHRLHSIQLVLNGMSCTETARMFGDSPRSVAYWVAKFKESGMEGLNEQEGRGRPTKLSKDSLAKVAEVILQQKDTITGQSLSEYIRRHFKVTLTVRQCSRLIMKATRNAENS
jgi:transposase